MNIKSTIKKAINKIVKICYRIFCIYIPLDREMILFMSYHGRGYQCSPKYLHKCMYENEKYKNYKFVWAVKKTEKVDIPNAKIVKYNGIKYFYYLSRSKYWIINCKMPNYIIKKKNQIYVQTWHGTPLKKLAHDIEIGDNATFYRTSVSKKEMTDSYDNDVKKYNYFISPNSFSTEKFESSFKINKEKIIESGYPRNDFLTNINKIKINNLREKYKIPKDKKVILYAPTWRDNSFTAKGYTFELNADFNLWKENLGSEYIIIFKPHYLITNKYSNEGMDGFIYTVNEDEDINELYVISDMLITDYSSVFFDYAILERPILFYMYDLEEYRDELRGFYLDINKDLPGEVITKQIDLLNAIINTEKTSYLNKEKLSEFNKKYNYLQDGECSKRVIEKIIN